MCVIVVSNSKKKHNSPTSGGSGGIWYLKTIEDPIERKPRPSGYKLFVFCVIEFSDFCIYFGFCVWFTVLCALCACTFFQVLVSGSSVVLQTTLGEHGREKYEEESSTVGGHPGNK